MEARDADTRPQAPPLQEIIQLKMSIVLRLGHCSRGTTGRIKTEPVDSKPGRGEKRMGKINPKSTHKEAMRNTEESRRNRKHKGKWQISAQIH